jgi:hypothetical protein
MDTQAIAHSCTHLLRHCESAASLQASSVAMYKDEDGQWQLRPSALDRMPLDGLSEGGQRAMLQWRSHKAKLVKCAIKLAEAADMHAEIIRDAEELEADYRRRELELRLRKYIYQELELRREERRMGSPSGSVAAARERGEWSEAQLPQSSGESLRPPLMPTAAPIAPPKDDPPPNSRRRLDRSDESNDSRPNASSTSSSTAAGTSSPTLRLHSPENDAGEAPLVSEPRDMASMFDQAYDGMMQARAQVASRLAPAAAAKVGDSQDQLKPSAVSGPLAAPPSQPQSSPASVFDRALEAVLENRRRLADATRSGGGGGSDSRGGAASAPPAQPVLLTPAPAATDAKSNSLRLDPGDESASVDWSSLLLPTHPAPAQNAAAHVASLASKAAGSAATPQPQRPPDDADMNSQSLDIIPFTSRPTDALEQRRSRNPSMVSIPGINITASSFVNPTYNIDAAGSVPSRPETPIVTTEPASGDCVVLSPMTPAPGSFSAAFAAATAAAAASHHQHHSYAPLEDLPPTTPPKKEGAAAVPMQGTLSPHGAARPQRAHSRTTSDVSIVDDSPAPGSRQQMGSPPVFPQHPLASPTDGPETLARKPSFLLQAIGTLHHLSRQASAQVSRAPTPTDESPVVTEVPPLASIMSTSQPASGTFRPRSRAASVASTPAPDPGLMSTMTAVVDAFRSSPADETGSRAGREASASPNTAPQPTPPLPTLAEARRHATLFDVLLRLRRDPSWIRAWKRRHVCLVASRLFMYRDNAQPTDLPVEDYDLTEYRGEMVAESLHGQRHVLLLRRVDEPKGAEPVAVGCMSEQDMMQWARSIKAAQKVAEAKERVRAMTTKPANLLPDGYTRDASLAVLDTATDKELLHRIGDAVSFFEPARVSQLSRMQPLFKGREKDVLLQSFRKHGGPPPSYDNRIRVFCKRHCTPEQEADWLHRLELAPRGKEYENVIQPMIKIHNHDVEY